MHLTRFADFGISLLMQGSFFSKSLLGEAGIALHLTGLANFGIKPIDLGLE